MNKKSRESISNIIKVLETVNDGISNLKNMEETSLSNLCGTSFEDSDKYCSIEQSSEYLGDAIDNIQEAIDNLNDAMYP